jgi:hypothetical protein
MLQKPDTSKPFFQWNPIAADRVRANRCITCNLPIIETDFTDDLSKKEYSVSGMCQKCQDKTFKEDQ